MKLNHITDSELLNPLYSENAFSRINEEDDAIFYEKERWVDHLDSLALSTVEKIINDLIIEEDPVILDLMAGWNSHIPERLLHSKITGLGLNNKELKQNPALNETLIHDLNSETKIPFADNTFDIVLNTVSVDYITKPFIIFREIGRILKPGGLFLVIFSNRMFNGKAVKVWRESDEDERILIVEEFFNECRVFERPEVFISKGRPRPEDDKYASILTRSDPVYAVYAEKKGGSLPREKRPAPSVLCCTIEKMELAKRKEAIKKSMCCPHCGETLKKWAVPSNPFAYTWDNDYMYICFNDECPYYIRGWGHMSREGNSGVSYRLMYNPEKDSCSPVPVHSHQSLREGIME